MVAHETKIILTKQKHSPIKSTDNNSMLVKESIKSFTSSKKGIPKWRKRRNTFCILETSHGQLGM